MDHMIHFLDSPAVSRSFFVVFQDTHLTFGKISFETFFFCRQVIFSSPGPSVTTTKKQLHLQKW